MTNKVENFLYEQESYHIRGACMDVWKQFKGMYKDIENQDWCDTVDNFIKYKFSVKREEADKKNLEDIKKLVCGSTRKRKFIEDFFGGGDSSLNKKRNG
jgi:hypothetical protein